MTPDEVRTLLAALAGTRERLRLRAASRLAEVLGRVGERFLDPGDLLGREALDAAEEESGLSRGMVRRVVPGMARDWTRSRLRELIAREFADPTVLDRFAADPRGGRSLRVLGDPVALHIGSGSVPGVSTTSMIRSLLVKTPVLMKPGRGDRALTEAFLRGLREADADLAASAAVAYWPGDDRSVLEAAVGAASRVVVYGSDAAAQEVRRLAPVTSPVVVYHHRFSVAVLGPAALAGREREATAGLLARAASTFDQRGCVSPHRVFLLGAGIQGARALGERLARAMEVEAGSAAPGVFEPGEAARLQQLRGEIRMRAAVDPGVAIWASPDTSWTVVVEPRPESGVAGHPRTVMLIPVRDREALLDHLRPLGPHLQSAGLAGLEDAAELVEGLAEVGVTRAVPLDELAFPPAWWVHDGAGPLRALVRWVEWEE